MLPVGRDDRHQEFVHKMGSLIEAGDAHGTDSEVDLFLREIGQAQRCD